MVVQMPGLNVGPTLSQHNSGKDHSSYTTRLFPEEFEITPYFVLIRRLGDMQFLHEDLRQRGAIVFLRNVLDEVFTVIEGRTWCLSSAR